jgi:hypothetical protein
MKLRLQLS